MVDRRGVTVYRDPEWSGLSKRKANSRLHQSAPKKPAKLSPPCDVAPASCARAAPSCLSAGAKDVPLTAKGEKMVCNAQMGQQTQPQQQQQQPSSATRPRPLFLGPPPPAPVFCCSTNGTKKGGVCLPVKAGVACPGGGGSQSLKSCQEWCGKGPRPAPPTVFCCNRTQVANGTMNASDPNGACYVQPPGVKCSDGRGSTGKDDCIISCQPPPQVHEDLCCEFLKQSLLLISAAAALQAQLVGRV